MESFKTLSMSKEIRAKLGTHIPEYLIKQKPNGKAKLNYISGAAVTDILNATFGHFWNWEVKDKWISEGQTYYNKYANGTLQKDPANWIEEPQGAIANVLGTLSVFLYDDKGNITQVKKDAFGSKAIIGKQSEQEHIFKSAGTDALKKAASLFGIGLDLYRDDNEQYHFELINAEEEESPWTDETKEQYKEELDYIYNLLTVNNFSEDDFEQIIGAATEGLESYITPDNIAKVLEFMTINYDAEDGSEV